MTKNSYINYDVREKVLKNEEKMVLNKIEIDFIFILHFQKQSF